MCLYNDLSQEQTERLNIFDVTNYLKALNSTHLKKNYHQKFYTRLISLILKVSD